MISGYQHETCDLCQATTTTTLLAPATPRSITSDIRILNQPVCKSICNRCGMVRSISSLTTQDLTGFYEEDYTLNTSTTEHHFFTPTGQRPRSVVFHDWLWHLLPAEAIAAQTVLEIGCSAGHLLARMQETLSDAVCDGVEFSEEAVALARNRGLYVTQGGIEAAPKQRYDLIYTIGVLEHVPSPRNFLTAIRDRLGQDGIFAFSQPIQDVNSYDVYFVDHLYHFGSDHLRMYAHQVGFREQAMMVGHPLMPNFSLHIWRPVERVEVAPIWQGATRCREAVDHYEAFFAWTNQLLEQIEQDPTRHLAVFGVNEVFALLMAYSRLGDTKIVCGLSDVEPPRPVDFPVIKPESAPQHGVTDVLLCINKIYVERVRERLVPLGITVHAWSN